MVLVIGKRRLKNYKHEKPSAIGLIGLLAIWLLVLLSLGLAGNFLSAGARHDCRGTRPWAPAWWRWSETSSPRSRAATEGRSYRMLPIYNKDVHPVSAGASKHDGPVAGESAASASVRVAGQGNPWIRLRDGIDLATKFVGSSGTELLLDQGLAAPLTLASGDFDEDGVADLVSGYAGPGGGVLTLHRGNIDSLWPGQTSDLRLQTSDFRLQTSNQTNPQSTFRNPQSALPFLAEARGFQLPVPPDFLQTGDFNADGHWDILAAAREDDALFLLAGNGKGRFGQPQRLELSGKVTALASGEMGRADGLSDVMVGVAGENGQTVLVFTSPQGALRAGIANPLVYDSPDEVSALAIAHLDDDYFADLVVAAGRDLLIVPGRDNQVWNVPFGGWNQGMSPIRNPQLINHLSVPFTITSMAVGDFIRDEKQRTEIALLSEDGRVQVVAIRDSDEEGRVKPSLVSKELLRLSAGGISSPGISKPQLIRARVSSLHTDELVVVDPASHQLHILSDNPAPSPEFRVPNPESRIPNLVSLEAESEPVAVLPMRLNADALSDLVILRKGTSAPTVVMTTAAATFTVTSAANAGAGSLRQAILDANNNLGPDEIVFNLPAGQRTISPSSALPIITEAITIDGTTHPAGRVELNGSGAGFAVNGLVLTGGRSVVRGLVINRYNVNLFRILSGDLFGAGGNGIVLASPNNIVEGNLLGTDFSGSEASGNGLSGVLVTGANNTVGGTNESARNLLSGNLVGVGIATAGGTGNLVRGNYVGTDVSGTVALANSGGVVILGASNNTIGGTTPGARNVISGNTKTPPIPDLQLSGGLVIANYNNFTGATTNLAQGNFLGLDASGANPLGNGNPGAGVFVGDSANNTIGGTTAEARNLISANSGDGIVIGGSRATGNLIQGNLIGAPGAQENASALSNSRNGVLVTQMASNTLIGGATGEAANTISFNGGAGVLIDSGTGNAVLFNSIFSNGGLGIDLGAVGVTASDDGDGDSGANNLQNSPVLTGSFTFPGRTSVLGTLNSLANTSFKLQFFTGNACDPSGFGEGQTFLRELTVTTDQSGNARLNLVLPLDLPLGLFVTATATDPANNTSEFSNCVTVKEQGTDLSVTKTDSPDPVLMGRTLTYTITVTNDSPIAATGVVLTDTLPSSVTFVSVSSSQGGCGGTTTVTCTIGMMASGGSVTVTIVTRASTAGMITNTASVRGDQSDPDLSNNSVAETTTILAGPKIEVTPTLLDFGQTPLLGPRELSVTVRNVGDAPLTVNRMTTNNFQFTVVSPTGSFTVGAGSQRAVTLRFAPNALGPQSAELTVSSDDADKPIMTVQLRGEGAPDVAIIEVTPGSLDFGVVPVGGAKDLTLTIRNLGTVTLTVRNIVSSNIQFSFVSPTLPVSVGVGASLPLTCRFRPQGEGVHTATLSITSDDPNRPTLVVQLRGEGALLGARIEVSPASVDFGQVVIGQTAEVPLILKNTGSAGMTVSSVTLNNSQFSFTGLLLPATLREKTEITVTVRFRPTGAGLRTADMIINSTAQNQPNLAVPLRGEGVAQPDIDVTPSALDFGRVGLRLTKDLTVVVRNTGSAALQVRSLSIAASPFTVVSPAVPFTLAVNGQRQVTVRFSPSALGVHLGSLIIGSNDLDEATVTVGLRGEGIGIPTIVVTPQSLEFGQVIRGESKELSLAVQNTGSATLSVTRIASSTSPFSVTMPGVPLSVDPGSQRAVTVAFRPTAVMQQSGVLTLESNDPITPTVTVQLRGEGVAAVPKIEVTPTSVDFGTVQLGESVNRTVTVRSVGNVPLVVTSLGVANPQFSLAGATVPLSLNPGSQQLLTIGFRPTAAGTQSDTLIITSNDSTVATLRVSLSGQAVVPPPREVSLSAPTNVVGFSGGTVSVPVSIGEGSAVSALRFTLMFDPAVLSVADAQSVSRGALVPQNFAMSVNLGTRGQVTILIAPPLQTPVPTLQSGSGAVAVILFRVSTLAQDGVTTTLHFDTASASDANARSVILNKRDGTITVKNEFVGDVTLDGQVNEQDLIRIIQHLTGENLLTGRGLQAADTNCDGQVNEQDLIRLIQHLTGERLLPPRCQAEIASNELGEASGGRVVTLGSMAVGLGQVALPLQLDDGAGIAAVGVKLVFDPGLIEIVGVVRGDLVPEEFEVFEASIGSDQVNYLLVPPLKAPISTLRRGPGSVLMILARPRRAEIDQLARGIRLEAVRLSDNQGWKIEPILF